MDALRQAAAVLDSRRDARPFAERFHQLLGLLRQPMLDFVAAQGAAELAAMLDEPGSADRRPGSTAARLMATEVDRLGERLQPLGRALLPALEAAQRGGGRRRSFEVAVALLHQHQAALSLLTMSCSFMFEGTIPATAGALRGVAYGFAAILPGLVPLMRAVRQQCQPARDGRLLGGFVMQHCDSLWRTVGCFQVACSGQEWPLFEAALPADVAQPWIQELITWADLSAPHHLDLAPTLAMLGRLLLAHEPLQAALERDLPLQRQLLRQMLKVVLPSPGAPETLTWVGDVEDANHILCCAGMEPALLEHVSSPQGLRTMQAAARLLQQPLPDLAAGPPADAERLAEAQHAVSKHTARLQLLETMLEAELRQPASPERAAIAACLLAEGQQAAVASVAAWRVLLRAPCDAAQCTMLVPVCRAIAVSSLAVSPDLLQGRRGLQAALSGLHSTLCLVWQLGQLGGEAAAHGPQLEQLIRIARGAATGMYPLALALTVAIEQASEAGAAFNSGGLSTAEQLRMAWQALTAFCCVLSGMPDETIPQQSQLFGYGNLLAMLLRAAADLAQQCPSSAQADAQRLLDSALLAYLAVAKHRQARPSSTTDALLRVLLLEPYLTSRPELRAGFEAGGGVELYMQVIRTLCEDPPLVAAAVLAQALGQQLQPPHANQTVAAALVASDLHRVLAAGGQAAKAEGPAAAELASALRELARKAVMVLGQAGSELDEAGTEPAIEEPFSALDGVIQESLEGNYFRLTPAALDAAEPLARALQQLWERQRQVPDVQAQTRVRTARAAAVRSCANLACPNLATGGPLKTKRCSGCKAVRYCCADCQAEDWREGGHRHACKLLQAEHASG